MTLFRDGHTMAAYFPSRVVSLLVLNNIGPRPPALEMQEIKMNIVKTTYCEKRDNKCIF